MKNKILTPLKAIRKNCLDCMCGSSLEVKLCPSSDCPLYHYRFGKYPAGTRKKVVLTEERKRTLLGQLNKTRNPEKNTDFFNSFA